jgi:hypothetical protein
MYGIGDQDEALNAQESAPGEWSDSLTSEQAGVATLRYQLASGQNCVLQLNYELATRAANEQLWWSYLTTQVADGKCIAPQDYVIEDVAVTLDIADVLTADGSLIGTTNTPKQGDPTSMLSIRKVGVPAQANHPSRYEFSPDGLEALCAERGVISEQTQDPPIAGDGGSWAMAVEDYDSGLNLPYVGASCIECLRHTCNYEVEQCEVAADCSVFTNCAAACDDDAQCSGACPDPFCDTGSEPGCGLLDCRNWVCDEVCGQEPFGGTPNQVYETPDAGTDSAITTSAATETEAPVWLDVDPNVFTLTRRQRADGSWSGTFEVLRLTVEF